MADRLIKLFVMESKKNLRTVDLSNWVGKVYIGNRKHVELIRQVPEIEKSTGLYFLLGKDIESDETYLYIGEADDVANRIKQHANSNSNMIFILNNLGLIDFVKTNENRDVQNKQSKNIFYINLKKANKDKQAKLSITDNGYVLLEGSYLEKITNKSLRENEIEKQNTLLTQGFLKDLGDVIIA